MGAPGRYARWPGAGRLDGGNLFSANVLGGGDAMTRVLIAHRRPGAAANRVIWASRSNLTDANVGWQIEERSNGNLRWSLGTGAAQVNVEIALSDPLQPRYYVAICVGDVAGGASRLTLNGTTASAALGAYSASGAVMIVGSDSDGNDEAKGWGVTHLQASDTAALSQVDAEALHAQIVDDLQQGRRSTFAGVSHRWFGEDWPGYGPWTDVDQAEDLTVTGVPERTEYLGMVPA